MADHECLHEADWAVFRDHQTDMGRDLKLVLRMLRGNGEPGIVTKLALQEQCLKKLHERLDDIEKDLSIEREKREEDVKGMRNKMHGALVAAVFMLATQLLRFL